MKGKLNIFPLFWNEKKYYQDITINMMNSCWCLDEYSTENNPSSCTFFLGTYTVALFLFISKDLLKSFETS